MNQTAGHSPLGLRVIGAFKLICGLLLVALGVGLFRHVNADPGEDARRLIEALRLDPDNHYIHSVIAKVADISPRRLKEIGIGTFLYALLYLVEGTGLLLKKHWAEYFTVVMTGLFIPLEIYEVIRRMTLVRVSLLAINVAIVAYLVYQLARGHQEKGRAKPEPGLRDASVTDHFTGGS